MPAESTNSHRRWPALRGALIAFLAAVLFGISTPLVQRLGAGVGSFSTAALLYAGAALIGAILRQPISREARVQGSDASRLLLMAIFGAGIGPVALAWGLQHTSGTSASLMLTMEAVFTAVLARLWYHETLDRRVTLAMGMLTLGGMVLVQSNATIAYTSSVLGFVPLALTAVYCSTKAGLHSYVLSQRFMLRDTNVRVLEIIPPWVRTELMNSQDAEMAMPLDQFVKESIALLGTDAEEVLVDAAKPLRANAGVAEHALVNDFNTQMVALFAGGY